MDVENLASLDKESEMKGMCRAGTVKTICLKDYNKCD